MCKCVFFLPIKINQKSSNESGIFIKSLKVSPQRAALCPLRRVAAHGLSKEVAMKAKRDVVLARRTPQLLQSHRIQTEEERVSMDTVQHNGEEDALWVGAESENETITHTYKGRALSTSSSLLASGAGRNIGSPG